MDGRLGRAVRVIEAAAEISGYDYDDLIGRSRRPGVVWYRQVAMFVVRELTDLSYPEIGAVFERHHTTVLYAVDKIGGRLAMGYPGAKAAVGRLLEVVP